MVALLQHLCLRGGSFDKAPKMDAESQGIMSSQRRFEMCVLSKEWRWDFGTSILDSVYMGIIVVDTYVDHSSGTSACTVTHGDW